MDAVFLSDLQPLRIPNTDSLAESTMALAWKASMAKQLALLTDTPLAVDTELRDSHRLAWAAGFIDGDGCITAVVQRYKDRKSTSIRIRVIVVQNDYYTLSVLQNILDERCVLQALKRGPEQNRQPYQLVYDGKHALAVIKKIQPYLVRKAAEADACRQLHKEGELDRYPGPKGISPDVVKRRDYWVKRLQRMK